MSAHKGRWTSRFLQWALLLVASLVLAFVLERIGLPAGLLLGPMIAGILCGCLGMTVRVSRAPVVGAQAIIGCLVAAAITAEIVGRFASGWVLFLGIVIAMNATSALLGWLISRRKILPGTTALWGSTPGGASAMMMLAEDFGADPRLVAVMQYSRVIMVVAGAALVARFSLGTPEGPPATASEAMEWLAFGQTLLLAAGGAVLGLMARIPAGPLLVTLVLGAVLNVLGLMEFHLPEWLLALSYAIIGWNVGLRFTPSLLAHTGRVLPQVLISNAVLIAACALFGWLLVIRLGLDPLTAFLATTPGSMDSIAIIAAASNVDLSFVVALQTARVAVVFILSPILARWLAARPPGSKK